MISKELLSEVLKEDFSSNEIEFEQADGADSSRIVIDNWLTINIYELAHKCKEWATENKYTILTEDIHPNGYFAYVLSNKESIEDYGYLCEHKVIKYIPHNKTEPEAIFAACQWILENK